MPGSDEDHDWFHTRNSQMDGKSKTSHISPTTLGQMIPVESANIDELQGVSQIGDDLRMVGDGDAIQDAVNDVGSQGWVIVRPDYDESVETFPITISNRVRLSGTGFRDIVAPDNSSTVLEIDFDTANDPPGPIIDHLGIQNGLRAISVADTQYGTIHGCHLEDAEFGLDIQSGSTTGSQGWTISQTSSINNNGAGFDTDSNADWLKVLGCRSINNGGIGIDVDDSNGVSIVHSEFRGNARAGIDLGPVQGTTISGCILEDNDDDNTADLPMSDSDQVYVHGSYFDGLNNNTTGVIIQSGTNHCTVRDCWFSNYTGTIIDITGGNNHDIGIASIRKNNSGPDISDGGSRTRQFGRVRMQDLSGVNGQFDGDPAIDDGTNTTSGRPELAIWDDTNSVWFTMGGDTI